MALLCNHNWRLIIHERLLALLFRSGSGQPHHMILVQIGGRLLRVVLVQEGVGRRALILWLLLAWQDVLVAGAAAQERSR